MGIFNFAHNGIDHSSQAEAAAHQTGSNIVWVLGVSLVMAILLYGVVRLLNRRQPEKIKPEEQHGR